MRLHRFAVFFSSCSFSSRLSTQQQKEKVLLHENKFVCLWYTITRSRKRAKCRAGRSWFAEEFSKISFVFVGYGHRPVNECLWVLNETSTLSYMIHRITHYRFIKMSVTMTLILSTLFIHTLSIFSCKTVSLCSVVIKLELLRRRLCWKIRNYVW